MVKPGLGLSLARSGTKCLKRGLTMKLVYACTLTSLGLAAASRFGSCQDHKQELCNTRTGTLGHEMLEKRAHDETCLCLHLDLLRLSCSFAFRFLSRPQARPMQHETWHTRAARNCGSHRFKELAARNARKGAPDKFCVWLHLDLLRSFAFRFLALWSRKESKQQHQPVALGLVRFGFTAPSCFLSCKQHKP